MRLTEDSREPVGVIVTASVANCSRYSPWAAAVSPASLRGRPPSRSGESVDRRPPRGDAEHRAHQHPHHVAHEAVGLDPELERAVAGVDPLRQRARRRSNRLWVVWVRREGGEVVRARQQRGARVQARRDRVGYLQCSARSRSKTLARAWPAPGSDRCATRHHGGRRSPPAPRRWPAPARRAAGRRSAPPAGAGSPGWLATCPRACTPASVRPATVSATGPAQCRCQRLLQLALDRAPARLGRPAGEARAVVLEQQPGGQGYPRLRATISRYSTSTENGPSPPAQPRNDLELFARTAAS